VEETRVVTFSVPWLPVSVNHTWDVTMYTDRLGYPHRGRKLSKEAIAWRHTVALFARGLTVAPTTERERKKVQYRVKIDVWFGPKNRGDADNFGKAALDALQACGVIHNDAKVKRCEIEVHKDDRHNPENPRTEFFVERLEG
jgi:Holliday junction resolvase RusA-like endonuclease